VGCGVVTEGIKNADGKPVFEVSDDTQRDTLNRALTGGVGNFLANVVTRELKIRCRCEKPGLCGRASLLHVSNQDLADAELVGRAGVRGAIEGRHAHAVALRPLGIANSEPGYAFVPLALAAGERAIPAEWLAEPEAGGVSNEFLRHARPIVGDLVDYALPLSENR
jgi:6-phosphofructokinase 1